MAQIEGFDVGGEPPDLGGPFRSGAEGHCPFLSEKCVLVAAPASLPQAFGLCGEGITLCRGRGGIGVGWILPQ